MTSASGTSDNQVFLRGRLASPPTVRELPSGDELCLFRITVARPPGGRVRVDSLDCSTTRVRVRTKIERVAVGDIVEVTGSLHRRFWRSVNGLASRYEVDVASVKLSSRRRSAA